MAIRDKAPRQKRNDEDSPSIMYWPLMRPAMNLTQDTITSKEVEQNRNVSQKGSKGKDDARQQ